MLEWWSANWEKIIAIVGTLLGVIGVYFGSKGWKRKKPTYLIRSNNIFSGLGHSIPDVEVKFRGCGQTIKALTITKVAFWNAGTETIKKQDVVKDDPITIKGEEGIVFLSASVIEAVSPHNKIDCKLNQDRSLVTITFDYLDHNQGANIQVFHTGTSNADITLKGTIMGASPIRRKEVTTQTPQTPLWVVLLMFCTLWLVWALFAFGILSNTPQTYQLVEPIPVTVESFGVVLLGLTVVFGILLYFTYIPKPFSKLQRQYEALPKPTETQEKTQVK